MTSSHSFISTRNYAVICKYLRCAHSDEFSRLMLLTNIFNKLGKLKHSRIYLGLYQFGLELLVVQQWYKCYKVYSLISSSWVFKNGSCRSMYKEQITSNLLRFFKMCGSRDLTPVCSQSNLRFYISLSQKKNVLPQRSNPFSRCYVCLQFKHNKLFTVPQFLSF